MKVFNSQNYKAFLQDDKCIIVDGKSKELLPTITCDSEILTGCITRDNQYIILTTVLKLLYVFRISNQEKVASVKMEKKCSALTTRLYNNVEYALVGDKVGDILAFDIPELKKKTFLVGHCATVITELVNIGDYLASSDRDEKVFICHFPQTFNIQSICVGHKQFISAMIEYNNTIITGSADGTIKQWTIQDGKCSQEWYLDECLKIESEEETLLIPSQLIQCDQSTVACIIDDCNKVLLISPQQPDMTHFIELSSNPVVMMKEGEELHVLTKDMKLFKIDSKNVKAEELSLSYIDKLKEMGYVYEKTTDEEESGELFKRSVKNKTVSSLGLEKQMEHNKKVHRND